MGTKINFGSDEEFIKNYQELKSSRKMGELYQCDKTSVLNHAKKIGFDVKSVQTYKLCEEDKKRIISLYNEKTSNELAKEYNVSRGMITKLWYDANLNGKIITHNNTMKRDITNKRFGRLVALYPTEERDATGAIKWLCQCDCGQTTLATVTPLEDGRIKSCGCLSKECLELGRQAEDLTGQSFGKLIVLKRCEDKIFSSGGSGVQWLCQCSCGRKTKVLASNLKSGNTQSCGLCGENSHGNTKIDKILTEANIPFEREKKFETCKDRSLLPFDFYVNNKYLIEYDGIQHFEESNTLFDATMAQKHDIMKNAWCLANNIPLIRIPYTQYDKLCLDDLLLETSKFIIK